MNRRLAFACLTVSLLGVVSSNGAFALRRLPLLPRDRSIPDNKSSTPASSLTRRGSVGCSRGGGVAGSPRKQQRHLSSPSLSRNETTLCPAPFPFVMRVCLRYDRVIQRLFDSADTNQDDSISESEVYELILKLLIYINRQAAINPPPRQRVQQMFELYDTDQSGRINRAEFTDLGEFIIRRILIKIMIHKLITVFLAPLFATGLVRFASSSAWLISISSTFLEHHLVLNYLPERVLQALTSPAFYHTVCLIFFVSTLGNFLMTSVETFSNRRLVLQQQKKQRQQQ